MKSKKIILSLLILTLMLVMLWFFLPSYLRKAIIYQHPGIDDYQLFNNRTISNILLTAYHLRSPVIGFSPAYVKAGALFALYSTPAQIGQQAGETARAGLASGSLPPPAAPRHFRVGINRYVARSMGINLDDAATLQERLERSEGLQ